MKVSFYLNTEHRAVQVGAQSGTFIERGVSERVHEIIALVLGREEMVSGVVPRQCDLYLKV